jgi:hypothetical protein
MAETNIFGFKNQVIELTFISHSSYPDSFNDVEFECSFYQPDGRNLKVPGFWDGENIWRVRWKN